MTETVIKTKRGQSVGLYLSDSSEDETRALRTPEDQEKKKFVGVDEEDEQYVFRKKGEFAFYDLGTRLRTVPDGFEYTGLELRDFGAVDEPEIGDALQQFYVEQRYEVQGSSLLDLEADTFLPPIDVSDVEFKKLQRLLLGKLALDEEGQPDDPLDPLEFTRTNVRPFGDLKPSHRLISHCMPLFYGQTTDLLSAIIGQVFPLKINGTFLPDLLADGRAYAREFAENDSTEDWGPDPPASGAAYKQIRFSKEYVKSLKGGPLQIQNPGNTFYYSFDTDDTVNIKITTNPDPSSDAQEYKFSGRDRVYLRPILGGMYRAAIFSGPLLFGLRVVANWVSRKYGVIGTILPSATHVAPFPDRNWIRRSEFSRYPEFSGGSATNGFVSFRVASEGVVDELPNNDLVAIIASPTKEYYLWRKRS